MSEKGVKSLIKEAQTNSRLRMRFSQDRSSEEMVTSANKQGYTISKKDARKILAGAYLTSDRVGKEEQDEILGGIAFNYLEEVESRLDRDFRMLEDKVTWERTEGFYEYVYE